MLGPTPGVDRNVYFPGFPTMKHLPYTGKIESAGIKVFDMASRNASVIISVTNESTDEEREKKYDLAAIGASLVGKDIFVGWPHLTEAKVVSVSDAIAEFANGSLCRQSDQRRFDMQVKSTQTQ